MIISRLRAILSEVLSLSMHLFELELEILGFLLFLLKLGDHFPFRLEVLLGPVPSFFELPLDLAHQLVQVHLLHVALSEAKVLLVAAEQPVLEAGRVAFRLQVLRVETLPVEQLVQALRSFVKVPQAQFERHLQAHVLPLQQVALVHLHLLLLRPVFGRQVLIVKEGVLDFFNTIFLF